MVDREITLPELTERVKQLYITVHQMSDVFWVLQGRVNTLELVCLQTIEDVARLQPDPKAYMRRYVERARNRALPLADVDDPAKAERTIKERDIALEEFLTTVLEPAGDLKL
jgi:hypothetical protein